MQAHAKLSEMSLTSIRPEGWLRLYLEKQRRGLTGHLEAAGFPFNTRGWACAKVKHRNGEAWWPYEQTAYWIDGMIRCGHLLGDKFLIKKATKHIDYVFDHADRDGYLGPKHLKRAERRSRWPHAVFFRAVTAHHSATGDKRVVRALARHYLSDTSDHSEDRDVCNVEIMCWAYEKTGDRRLLERALKAYGDYNRNSPEADTSLQTMLSRKRPTEHGVTYNEIAKLGAILYMHTGRRRFLDATLNAYRKLDRFSMLIDGVPSSSEHLRGKDPLDSHETCDIADYTWSAGYLLMATGRADYGDKIERACFNAAPGAVRHDFKALQYFSCPNQVIADATSNHNLYHRGFPWMSYRPQPGTQCCPGEVNRIMPNYVARMWLRGRGDEIAAALYGPSRLTTTIGETNRHLTIVEETDYPFSDRIDFEIRTEKPAAFTLSLRIPGWCKKARVLLNGKALARKPKPGTFFRLRREFKHNDRVTLELPAEIKISRWPRGGVGVERGALVYALPIKEDWQVDTSEANSSAEFPAWNAYPASAWNYALAIDGGTARRRIEVRHRPVTLDPWSPGSAPILLRVGARRIANWKLLRKKRLKSQTNAHDYTNLETLRGNFLLTPPLPEPGTIRERQGKRPETVTLVPYGCTHLRIAVFPRCD